MDGSIYFGNAVGIVLAAVVVVVVVVGLVVEVDEEDELVFPILFK